MMIPEKRAPILRRPQGKIRAYNFHDLVRLLLVNLRLSLDRTKKHRKKRKRWSRNVKEMAMDTVMCVCVCVC